MCLKLGLREKNQVNVTSINKTIKHVHNLNHVVLHFTLKNKKNANIFSAN